MVGSACLADPGKARGCSTNTSVTHSVSDPLVPTAQRRRYGQSAKMIKLARSVIVNFLETLPSSFVKGLWCFFCNVYVKQILDLRKA